MADWEQNLQSSGHLPDFALITPHRFIHFPLKNSLISEAAA